MSNLILSQMDTDPELLDSEVLARAVSEDINRIASLKTLLKDANEVLFSRFKAKESIRRLVLKRAWLVDQVLSEVWQKLDWPEDNLISLVAVGGYGRGELHPQSDIDLLILLESEPTDQNKHCIEKFLTLLWDIGLEVGQSVRTIEECVELAKTDITIATNLMESRTIAGSSALLVKLVPLIGRDKIWSGKDFFQAKWDEQKSRHLKNNNTEYNLEPNIKTAPGGLRDIQMIGWVAKRHFGVSSLRDLTQKGFLTEDEYSIIDAGESFLWRVRFVLHMITGRDENRLLFDYQKAVADEFGYKDTDASLAVEHFMKRYYRMAVALAELNDVLLQHFDEAIIRENEETSIIPLNDRFYVHNNYIEVNSDDVFEKAPSALLEIFVLMAHNPSVIGIRASTIRLIRDSRHLINAQFRKDAHNSSLFMELLRAPRTVFAQLKRMKRYGVLGRYIPQFGDIIGQMQYDLFHIYTVDAHTLLVIQNMRRLQRPELQEQFPIGYQVSTGLPKIELLYIAGLFHDIGKGRKSDHSELGAIDGEAFCQQMGLGAWDTSLVVWLIRSHLLMSMTAQKKDVSDPDVINEFAQLIGDQVRLDYLYALTVADICATNPTLWNGWRATLMRQLYTETKRALRRGLSNPVNKQEWIDDTRNMALIYLRRVGIKKEEVEEIWNELGEEYFLRESAADIAWHCEAILRDSPSTNKNSDHPPLILIRETTDLKFEGASQIFVYTKDQPNLFATTVTALDQLQLTIVDARIITSSQNFSLDTYIVLDKNSSPIGHNPDRINRIKDVLENSLSNTSQFPQLVGRRLPRQLKHFSIRSQAFISNNPENKYTVVEIQSLDTPGLLAKIGQIFAQFNLSVVNARIATLGEKVEDVFFVTDSRHQPITDPELCQEICKSLRKQLDELNQSNVG
ncbi:MAG: [protein-PII] uridylyltransferase [Pseudomonadales bacterium]|nr:[protein-PII] uridylyltransferase [Pseudomonadales bacterium]